MRRNDLFFSKRYKASLFDLIDIDNNFITCWFNNTLHDEQIRRVSILAEVLFIMDEPHVLPWFDLQDSELRTYIKYLSI